MFVVNSPRQKVLYILFHQYIIPTDNVLIKISTDLFAQLLLIAILVLLLLLTFAIWMKTTFNLCPKKDETTIIYNNMKTFVNNYL